MSYKAYSGVGSRSTPPEILSLMQDVAFKLSQEGWTLRSGGAEGADEYFEKGATNSFTEIVPEIYLPWSTFNLHNSMSVGALVPSKWDNWERAQEMASNIHPAWNNLSPAVKTLHSRNVYQILGKNLDNPSKFVLFYATPTKDGLCTGGTRTAVALAKENSVPTLNLFFEENVKRLNKYLED